jgi:hypothetical protein
MAAEPKMAHMETHSGNMALAAEGVKHHDLRRTSARTGRTSGCFPAGWPYLEPMHGFAADRDHPLKFGP